MGLCEPYKNVSSDSEYFVIPHLPGEVKKTRKHVPAFVKNKQNSKEFTKLLGGSKGITGEELWGGCQQLL